MVAPARQPEDDAAFLRAVQAPNRGVGATTLAKLGELAQGAFAAGARRRIGGPAETVAGAFGERDRRLHRPGARAARRRAPGAERTGARAGIAFRVAGRVARTAAAKACSRCAAATWRNSPTGSRTRAAPASPNWPRNWPAQPCRPRQRRQPGAADEPARGQGTGVPLRVHRRRRGRHAAARGQHRRRPAGGRAPPALRRHHPRQGTVVAIARARGHPLGRQAAPRAEPFPRRTARGRTAARRRRSGRGRGAQAERAAAGFADIRALLDG